MKRIALLMIFIFAGGFVEASECFKADISRGSIDPQRRDAVLILQYAGNHGGRGFVAVTSKDGTFQATGETRCRGGAPDSCIFGEDGARGYFQYLQNRPTISLSRARLTVVGDDDEELDVRAVANANSFNYALEPAEQKICAGVFPQLDDPDHLDEDGVEKFSPASAPAIR